MVYCCMALWTILNLTFSHGVVPETLVVGSSFISPLDKYLAVKRRLLHLPVPVILAGQLGLWMSRLRELTDHSIKGHPLDNLVLHLGANNIRWLNTNKWCWEREAFIHYIWVRYFDTGVVWSNMLPRRTLYFNQSQMWQKFLVKETNIGPGIWFCWKEEQ